jgi:hypothetical protein
MRTLSKALAIAATLIATLAPAQAAEPMDTTNPAYRVITAFTLYDKPVLQQCRRRASKDRNHSHRQ